MVSELKARFREENREKSRSRVAKKMSNTTLKYEVPLFDGKSNFTPWKSTIRDYLVQQGLDIALEDQKPRV